MMPNFEAAQRIVRLTPLSDALAFLDAVALVHAREIAANTATGRVLAADAVAAGCPAQALALRDGWAVKSDLTLDANSYSPAVLPAAPIRVDAGEPMPPNSDAVAPFELLLINAAHAEAIGPIAPGEGVLLPAADAPAGQPMRRAGERLGATDVAVLMVAGINRVMVREPRIRLVRAGPAHAAIDAAVALIAQAVGCEGGSCEITTSEGPDSLEGALTRHTADACIVFGGTGTGRHDVSVTVLRRIGDLDFHGVALAPGETLAFGWADTRPVLLLQGRLDGAAAGWLTVGRLLLAKLCGRTEQQPAPVVLELSRKVTSTIGMAEVVPVRRRGQTAEPLASHYLPLSSLASDGWILVPPESEGYPSGTQVAVRPWP
jgi:molybdopterin molybdotransferase